MNESEFHQKVDEIMLALEESLDEQDADIEYDNISGVLTLEFENGSQIIINRQAPTQQIWVAAKSGGFHFEYDQAADRWHIEGHSDTEFLQCLNGYCSDQAGEPVSLTL